jgi:hypothetical protein
MRAQFSGSRREETTIERLKVLDFVAVRGTGIEIATTRNLVDHMPPKNRQASPLAGQALDRHSLHAEK